MTKWDILGISRTNDIREIKKAYHKKLRLTNPEEDQKGFIKLRQAYEQAVEEAESGEEEEEELLSAGFYDDTDESEEEYEEYEEQEEEAYEEFTKTGYDLQKREMNREFDRWRIRFYRIYQNVRDRWNEDAWYGLLYEDIPYQMKYYEKCRKLLYEFLFNKSDEVYLPEEVWKVIDGFFDYSGVDAASPYRKRMKQNYINKKIKLNELFDFSLFEITENMEDINCFHKDYAALANRFGEAEEETDSVEEQEELLERLRGYDIFYLPFECLYLAYHFSSLPEEKMELQIKELEDRRGENTAIRVLKAEYALFRGEDKKASQMLKDLYRKVPVRDYVTVFQLAECCRRAGLWYEAWSLYRMLTRLNPKPFMFSRARKMYYKGKEAGVLLERPEDDNPVSKLDYRELQAKELFERQKYQEAIDYCNELLEEYPLSYPVILLRSYADWNCNYYIKRYRDLNWLIEMNPEGVRARLLSAYILYDQEEFELALEVLEPVKEKCAVQMEIINLALSYIIKSHAAFEKDIMRFLKKSMEQKFPVEAKSRHRMFELSIVFEYYTFLLIDANSKEDSEKLLNFCFRLKESKYNHPEIYMDWIKIYSCAGKYDKALELCENRIRGETDPDKVKELKISMFNVCYHAKLYKKAFSVIHDVENEKDLTEQMHGIAEVYEWAGMRKEAEKFFRRYAEYDYRGIQRLAEYYYRQGKWKKAEEEMQRSIRIGGQYGTVYTRPFNLYCLMEKYDEALEFANMIRQYAKSDYLKKQYYGCLATVYMGKGDFKKGLEYCEMSEKARSPIRMWEEMAICSMALQRYETAMEFLKKKAYEMEEVSILHLCIIQHCRFFLDGKTDPELTESIHCEIEKKMAVESDMKKRLYCYMAEKKAQEGKYHEALSCLEQAQGECMCPECGRCYEILWGRAWISIYQGKYEEGMTYLEKAMELNPSDRTLYVEYLELKKRKEDKA